MDALEDKFLEVVGYCGVIPNEKNVEGFISSFFNWIDHKYNSRDKEVESKYRSDKKKSILNENEKYLENRNKQRGYYVPFEAPLKSDFDKENNTIRLSKDEEDFLNEEYFNKRVNKHYEIASQALNSFYSEFSIKHKYALLEKLKQLYENLSQEDYSCYEDRPVLEYKNLNIIAYKDYLSNQRQKLKQNIKDKIRLIEPNYFDNNLEKGLNPSVEDYIKQGKIKVFEKYEQKLIEKKFLDDSKRWIKNKKLLVQFHCFCQDQDILKIQFKTDNKFLREFLEIRYSLKTLDQGKPNKYRKDKTFKAQYWFLN